MIALTHTSWINAWTLQRACAALGVTLRTTEQPPYLALPVCAAEAVPADAWQLCTEEASLRRLLLAPGAARFWPRRFPLELLDDKWAWGEWLQTVAQVPAVAQYRLDDPALPFPVVIKPRHSWIGEQRLPRGWVCRGSAELSAALRAIDGAGLQRGWYFAQRWIGDGAVEVLSVCGHHDTARPERHLICVVQRLADYGEAPGSSAVLRTVDDVHGLRVLARTVLDRLEYRGPFELEFLVSGGTAHVLELNPRFWMQHGIFLAAGNGLLKRYLDLDGPADWGRGVPEALLWIDGLWFWRRLLRLDRRYLGLLRQGLVTQRLRAVMCPSPGAALAGLLRGVVRGAWRRLMAV